MVVQAVAQSVPMIFQMKRVCRDWPVQFRVKVVLPCFWIRLLRLGPVLIQADKILRRDFPGQCLGVGVRQPRGGLCCRSLAAS